ncbi:zinc finger protein DZIP1L [Salvelinus namaycush]|uniref:Zinc finger protein DZIP1L n=1 Tax=Salvelinus namaycush TaxID=8040 RepID=A0A8U1BYN2_SALNM|nr:zinc finger protein DZIP1L [Salvelinus namaycush]
MPGQFRTPSDPPVSSLLSFPSSWSPGHLHPLRFRVRTESMDWRRLSALDVDHVAREMDVVVLQEYISAVTFCDVTGERCPHCRSPADPALVKLLRMSQLSTEYLLHCQDYLSSQVSELEDRLQGALSKADREGEERARLDSELQATKQESKLRKKMLATQQLLLQASFNNYHKCQCCEKSFINYSYLQAHLQRRHPELTDTERQKKRQVEQMEDGIEELRERLKLSQTRLDIEREAEALRKQQELEDQRRQETSEREKMESWKEEERKKFKEEMRDLKQLFLQEFRDMASRSSSIEAKLQELQTREEVTVSNLGSYQEDDELQQREEAAKRMMKKKMSEQKREWNKRFKEVQNRHMLERDELQSENDRLQLALSVEHRSDRHRLEQQVTSLSARVQQKDRLIRSQEDKINRMSRRPVAGLEDSGETRRRLLESLRRNPALVKEFRAILEETLEERLEKMGLRKGTKGISKKSFKSLSALVSGQRHQMSKQKADLLELRESLARELTRRVHALQRSQGTTVPTLPRQVTIPSTTPQSRTPLPSVLRMRHQEKTFPLSPALAVGLVSLSPVLAVGLVSLSPALAVGLVSLSPALAYQDYFSWVPCFVLSGSVVKTLTRSLERQLSFPMTKPVGGTRVVVPPATAKVLPKPKPRTALKTLQLSDEESDLELSSIEELLSLPVGGQSQSLGGRGSTEVGLGGTSGTSVWSSSTSRAGGL